MIVELLVFFVGMAYGYMKKGRQDKGQMIKTGIIWGLVIALVLAAVGYLLDNDQAIGFGEGFVGLAIAFIVMVLLFVAGVWVGDWVEHRKAPRGA